MKRTSDSLLTLLKLSAVMPLLGILSFLGSPPATAATLSVSTFDNKHVPLPGVDVTLQPIDGGSKGQTRTVLSQANGEALFADVPAGRYTVASSLQGFLGLHSDPITLSTNTSAHIDLMLTLWLDSRDPFGAVAAPALDQARRRRDEFEAKHPGVEPVGGNVTPPICVSSAPAPRTRTGAIPDSRGWPLVELLIDEHGSIVDWALLSGEIAVPFGKSADEIVRSQCGYTPATRQGKPVAVFVFINIPQ